MGRDRGHVFKKPSAWVERFAALVPPDTTVLDVACGDGRHSRFFLARGNPVTAIDRDMVLDDAPGLTRLEIDLETGAPWPLGEQRFGGVVVTNYLYRPLFRALIRAVAPGGVLIYETFARGNERFGRPRNPIHLLERGELLDLVFGRLSVVAFEDIAVGGGRPAMIQRICAVAPDRVG
jgi:SAM-dependent methyltransferase